MGIERTVALLSVCFIALWGCGPGGGSSGSGGEGGTGGAGGSGGSQAARVIGKVVLEPATATIREGETVQLEARVFDTEGEILTDAALNWSSDDEDIAAVDESGLVTGFLEGSAVIAVHAGTKAASATIEVTAASVAKVKLVLPSDAKKEGDAVVLAVDFSSSLQAIAYDEGGEELARKLKWTSDDTAVATVSSSGVVQGIGPGRTWITASLSGKTAKVEFAVVHRFRAISVGGSSSCALNGKDRAWCWGSNLGGRLGNGSESDGIFSSPVAVVGDHRFSSISVGTNHVCALDLEGHAWCWGLGFEHSLGGTEANEEVREPRAIGFNGSYYMRSISVGGASSCAILENGDLSCWGQVNGGQLPTRLWGNLDMSFSAVSVSKGGDFFCVLDLDGAPWCWGLNDLEQVSSPAGGIVSSPKKRAGEFDEVLELSAGLDHVCAGTLDGPSYRTICWGGGSKGQTGSPPYPASSSDVTLDLKLTGLSAGMGFSCGIVNQRAFCWGTNASGQLGADPASTPKSWDTLPIASLDTRSVSAGVIHACALALEPDDEENGKIFCWGSQKLGLLGNGVDEDTVSGYVFVDGQEVEP